MNIDEFRIKYPGSTEEQVRLYGEAVAAELAWVPEPDVPMPLITMDVKADVTRCDHIGFTSRYVAPHFCDVPPDAEPVDLAPDLREILSARGYTPTDDMTEEDMLARLAGAPNAREFAELN